MTAFLSEILGLQDGNNSRDRALCRVASSLLALICIQAACTPFSSKMDSWIGQPVEKYLAIPDKGTEKIEEVRGPDERGHKIYVISIEKQCRFFWDVDAQGIVTAWRSEGSHCKYYTN